MVKNSFKRCRKYKKGLLRSTLFQLSNSILSGLKLNHRPKKNMGALTTNLFLVTIFLMPILSTGLYLGSCNFHVLASVLPICSETKTEYQSLHRGSWFHIVGFAGIQQIFVTLIMSGGFPYIAVGLHVICEGLNMIKDLR